jgi:hypothetical protein
MQNLNSHVYTTVNAHAAVHQTIKGLEVRYQLYRLGVAQPIFFGSVDKAIDAADLYDKTHAASLALFSE